MSKIITIFNTHLSNSLFHLFFFQSCLNFFFCYSHCIDASIVMDVFFNITSTEKQCDTHGEYNDHSERTSLSDLLFYR